MMNNGLFGNDRSLINNEINGPINELGALNRINISHSYEAHDISERKSLLDWLEYNDAMFFEKAAMPDTNTKEIFWFQKYINMPLDELKKTVSSRKINPIK